MGGQQCRETSDVKGEECHGQNTSTLEMAVEMKLKI